MVCSIGGISFGGYDYEYYRIILQLRELGITPSGDKEQDKIKLNSEKNKIIQAIKTKVKNKDEEEKSFEKTLNAIELVSSERQQMELERLGAQNVAELNRIYFSL